ncbi:endoribonuclease L-PSP [Haloterrigena salina JCM 13891]|uniref:Endoribonuclease L-PSP n=1 Tax=Haloterrigena salina JCM 13891 TaxID=1227488 RepID=M0C947_9EURY|nr:RidA family protein [Haloterrigena salina]ELZ18434.1 endoribonuclease L-PSP [Haloterrigena salina JCM 13891]
MDRYTVSSGTEWESTVGYSRAVRAGSQIHVAGTTATDEDGNVVAPDDPYRQTERALELVADALEEAGAGLEDVVRTRIYVTDIDDWEAIGRAHGEVFGDIRPATSMVEVQRLIGPDHRVEIEAVAIADDGR